MTSTGRRIEMSLRGLAERGRPPLLTTARDKALADSSGSSLYSCGRMMWASTLRRSDFKVRRETSFFTIVGLSHAEDVTRGAPRRVPNYDQSTSEQAITDDARFTVISARVLDLNCSAREDNRCIFEVEPTLTQCLVA